MAPPLQGSKSQNLSPASLLPSYWHLYLPVRINWGQVPRSSLLSPNQGSQDLALEYKQCWSNLLQLVFWPQFRMNAQVASAFGPACLRVFRGVKGIAAGHCSGLRWNSTSLLWFCALRAHFHAAATPAHFPQTEALSFGKPSVRTMILFGGKSKQRTVHKKECCACSSHECFKITTVQSPLCAAPATGPVSGL